MSLTQLYALSAPALLGVLAIGFGLFELQRVRRIKASFAAPAVAGVQDTAPDQVSGAISEASQSTPEPLVVRVLGSSDFIEDRTLQAKLELSKTVEIANQIAEAARKLNEAMDKDKSAHATATPQEKTDS
jgi:hypothetical protein